MPSCSTGTVEAPYPRPETIVIGDTPRDIGASRGH
jgi:hypothetical protein